MNNDTQNDLPETPVDETETDEEEELATAAFQVIIAAGEARDHCAEALEAARKGDFETAEAKLAEAKDSIAEAHHGQTDIIQAEARGEKHAVTLLFIHAQDTLMTIMSEVNLTREMIEICKLIYSR